MKLIHAPATIAISALLLAGCTSTPEALPTASRSPVPTASPTATPTPTAEPGVFTLSGAGWSIHGPDGDASGIWGDANGAPSADDPDLPATFAAFLGAEPTVSTKPGNSHSPDYTVYTWPGLVLGVSTSQKDDFHWNPYVLLTAARSGTVELRTASRFVVGAAQRADVAAASFSSGTDPDGNTFYNVEPDHEVPEGEQNDAWNTVLVTVSPDGTILRIVAPSPYGNVL